MPNRKLLTVMVLLVLASAVGCVQFVIPAPTSIPFATITATVPTLPPVTPTPPPPVTVQPPATTPPPTVAAGSPTSAAKAATATRTPPRAALTPTSQPALIVESLLVGPGQPGRLYAYLREQHYTMLDHKLARLVVSDDMGAKWSPFTGGLPVSQECMYNVNMDYATVDELYASTCQGIYHWSGVNKWRRISDLKTRMVAVTYQQSMNLWVSVIDNKPAPIVKSTDGGASFQAASQGLVHFNGVANLGIDPRDAKTLYAIIMPKYGGSYLRRKMGENQWQEMVTPLDNSQIDVGMTIDGATGALYVTVADWRIAPGQTHWQVWRSSNPTAPMNNVKWEKVYDFGDATWATMLASGWSPQGLALYARVTLATQEQVLMRSLDSGKTWTILKIP